MLATAQGLKKKKDNREYINAVFMCFPFAI